MGEGKGLRGGKDHMSKGMKKGVQPTGRIKGSYKQGGAMGPHFEEPL